MKEIVDIRAKTVAELHEQLLDARMKQFHLRLQKGLNPQNIKSNEFKALRKQIARIKTIVHQKAGEL